MTAAGKMLATVAVAVLLGGALSLWLAYGNGVYAAYLSGAFINCF